MVNFGDKAKEESMTSPGSGLKTERRKTTTRNIKSAFAIPGRVSSSTPRTGGGGGSLQRRSLVPLSDSRVANGKENISSKVSLEKTPSGNGVKHRLIPNTHHRGMASPQIQQQQQHSHRRRREKNDDEDDDLHDDDDDEHEKKTRRKKVSSTTTSGSTASCTTTCKSHATSAHSFVMNYVPFARKFASLYNRLPRRAKIFVLCSWLVWKVVMTFLFLKVVFKAAKSSSTDVMDGIADLSAQAANAVDSSLAQPAMLSSNKPLEPSQSIAQNASPTGAAKRIPYTMLDTLPPPPNQQPHQKPQHPSDQLAPPPKTFRIMHIVTSLVEYNTGGRGTNKGEDRLGNVLLPVLRQTILSMTSQPYWSIDVQLILGYTLSEQRRQFIHEFLKHTGVGIVEIWEDAIPLSYNQPNKDVKMKPNTRGLARQHRFVIKDKLDADDNDEPYDFFMAYEDDMYVTSDHVRNFWDMSREFESLRLDAVKREQQQQQPQTSQQQQDNLPKPTLNARKPFVEGENRHLVSHGPLSSQQLQRLVPGFVRVEVLPPGTQEEFLSLASRKDKVPPDFDFYDNGTLTTYQGGDDYENLIRPNACCSTTPTKNITTTGGGDETYLRQAQNGAHLVMWESHIVGVTLRELPPLPTTITSSSNDTSPLPHNWVAFLPGPKKLPPSEYIRAYWGGETLSKKHLFELSENHNKKPGAEGRLFANQGGFMAGRQQLLHINQYCGGRILPPFSNYSPQDFKDDGLVMHNVEFWSGGYQIYSGIGGGCNMQRVLSLDPRRFEKQLMYHTANNKQRTIFPKERRFTRAVDYLGQLNAVRKMAEEDKKKRLDESGGGGELLLEQKRRRRLR